MPGPLRIFTSSERSAAKRGSGRPVTEPVVGARSAGGAGVGAGAGSAGLAAVAAPAAAPAATPAAAPAAARLPWPACGCPAGRCCCPAWRCCWPAGRCWPWALRWVACGVAGGFTTGGRASERCAGAGAGAAWRGGGTFCAPPRFDWPKAGMASTRALRIGKRRRRRMVTSLPPPRAKVKLLLRAGGPCPAGQTLELGR